MTVTPSVAKLGELSSSVLDLASDRHEVVVLEDNNDILCDTPHKMIKIKRGLAPEVKVSAQYSHHALATGARPVPADNKGKREKAGWDFHYKEWPNPENLKYRSGALFVLIDNVLFHILSLCLPE
jgi:hypothetical protein